MCKPQRALSEGARLSVLAAGILLVAACGAVRGPVPEETPSGEASTVVAGGVAGFPSCATVPQIRADEASYRQEPVYGNAEDLRQEVHGWAADQPGFVELGLDRERNGWITLWVKGADVAAMQEDVARRWPGEGIVVVEVPWTTQELEAVRAEVDAALRGAGVRTSGSGVSPHRGVVEIHLGVITAEAEAVLADFAGQPLCVDGVPASEAPEQDGVQPTAGDGWRLLGQGLTGETYRTSVATTDDQLQQMWRTAGLDGDAPQVDWENEIAVWFGAVYGSGCPVRMDGVVVEGDLLHADLVVPGALYGCNADANPHAFVVAVARDVLPNGPFRVQLGARDPYPGAPEERTVVDVDLTAPGSTATNEQVHPDASLTVPTGPPLVTDGDDLPADQPVRYVFRDSPGCDTPVLGPLDGSIWRLADREAPWDVRDGDELTLYPLGGSNREIVVSAPHMDWLFVRLPPGESCP